MKMTTVKLTAGLIRNQKLHLLHPRYGIQKCVGHYRTGAFAVNETVVEIEGGQNWNAQSDEERDLIQNLGLKVLAETIREITDGRVPFEAVCQRCLGKDIEVLKTWVARIDEKLAEEGVR